ncbi:MAG: histidine kinase [Nitrospirae bacterium GWC2_42_7]|nr:MAG: histidine kinase [Nitrospirae bacterium GWC2_42_7]
MALILIIDDSTYMRSIIRNTLKEEGLEILEAENGLKGIQMISEHSPDCVLLDIIMPGMDGIKILNTLQERDSKIPVIIITADIQESTRKQCLELGAFAFINKPPKKEELVSAIKKVLAREKELKQ